MNKYLVTLLVFCLALSACSAKNEESSASLTGSWKLTSYGSPTAPTDAVPDTEAGISFNKDGTVTGNAGCNGFGGNYSVEGDQVSFDQMTSTLMACDDPRMAQEDAVHKVLTDTASYKVEGNTLTITNNDMALVLTR